MADKRYVLALDQGTTSSRAMIINAAGQVCSVAQRPVRQIFPQPGWVEHDPIEIWSSQIGTAVEALASADISAAEIAAIGITNQRETTLLWDRTTGKPVHNAIVWQDRRNAEYCDQLKTQGLDVLIQKKTGLLPDAYFSASKLHWLLNHVPGLLQKALNGELAFGTVDSWLIWNLSNGKKHVTDPTNASRTMIFNIHSLQWDDELLSLFGVPRSLLPEVVPSSGECARSENVLRGIPIAGIAGDQQAALFGQMCTRPGMVKCTYGTGSFMLLHLGERAVRSEHRLLTTIAWGLGGKVEYALEGSMMMAGAVVQWLRDELQIVRTSSEIEALAQSVPDSGGVVLVPAFSGLGAPYWDQHARGAILGMTRGTSKAHIARAALEGIALQAADVLEAMQADSGLPLTELRVDGGAAANNMLMQLQANMLGVRVVRPKNAEATAMGAAYLAGLGVGYWLTQDEIARQWQVDRVFEPVLDNHSRENVRARWRRAVERARNWEVQ